MRKRLGGLLISLLLLAGCGTVSIQSTDTPELTSAEVTTPDPTPTETPIPGALTAEELQWFEEVFFRSGDDNIRNVFGSPYNNTYEKPQDINLIELFYDGSHLGDPVEATEAEIDALTRLGAFPEMWNELSGESGAYICPAFRVTCGEMNEVLLKYTGLTLEETNKVGLDKLPYLEEYDAYYWMHGDVGYPGPLKILSGVREGSTVKLYQRYNETLYCLTLEQQPEGNYWFVSNLPIAEEN